MKEKKIISLLWLLKILLLVATICLTQTKLLAASNRSEIFISKKNFEDDKKPAKKEKSFKNQNVVKVYPDVIKKAMHIVARSGNAKEIEFLVFDINGNMVLNYKMKAGERRTISELKRGSYMYHVFAEDEYLTTGKIVFR
jgi:hypothetical protein